MLTINSRFDNSIITHHQVNPLITVLDNTLYDYEVNDLLCYLSSIKFDSKYTNNEDTKTDRDNDHAMFTDQNMFEQLYTYRIRRFIPIVEGRKFVRSDTNIDVVRYGKNGFFDLHIDYQVGNSSLMSEYTLLICLTGNSTTSFVIDDKVIVTENKPGRAIIFHQSLYHSGDKVEFTKTIIRSNLLYGEDIECPILSAWNVLEFKDLIISDISRESALYFIRKDYKNNEIQKFQELISSIFKDDIRRYFSLHKILKR